MAGRKPTSADRRERRIRALLVIASPLVFLAAVEACLRLGGFGHPSSFFLPLAGADTTNETFGWRFFAPAIARTPAPLRLARAKPPGTYRVFVLGESAAMGVPEPAFGLPPALELTLRKRYPGRAFEVVNAAMTAINSHAIVDIARECAARDPDLFVVYAGNNEVVGPYGPGTAFAPFTASRTLIRMALWLKSLRLGQVVSPAPRQAEWRGMAMFLDRRVTADDKRLPDVYSHFRANLMEIVALARSSGARVLLSTVAVNLEGQPPFGSDGPDLPAAAPGCDPARTLAAAHPTSAEAQYRAGIACQDKALLERARDLDTLRFRADSRINGIVRQVAREEGGVLLADPAARGGFAFYEHVHFTPEGNLQLAAVLADALSPALGPPLAAEATAAGLGLTGWDRRRMAADIRAMTSQAPFRQPVLPADLDAPGSAAEAVATCGPQPLRLRCIEAYRASGRYDEAIRGYRTLLSEMGDWASWHAGLGAVLAETGRHPEAEAEFALALRRNPHLAAAHFGRGVSLAAQRHFPEAAAAYEEALRIQPRDHTTRDNLAAVHDAMGRAAATPEQAIVHLRETARLKPEAAEAYYNLGAMLSRAGRLEEAVAAYRQALARNTRYAEAHNNLGTALARQGKLSEAATHFRRALEIRPDYAEARRNLELATRR